MTGNRQPAIGNRSFPLTTLASLGVLFGCQVTPLTNKIRIGEEPFVIAVGEGADSLTDLWAASAGGGGFIRLSFNRAEERAPRLAPDGRRLAFLRRIAGGADSRWHLVLLDLLSNAEWTTPLPAGAGDPEALGWSPDGARVVLRAGALYQSPAPPALVGLTAVSPEAVAAADSLTRERLGPGNQGMLAPCDGTLCVQVGGAITSLGDAVRGALRWGPDSVGYFRGNVFEVRPLGGGRVRRPAWQSAPAGLRSLTHHPGVSSPR